MIVDTETVCDRLRWEEEMHGPERNGTSEDSLYSVAGGRSVQLRPGYDRVRPTIKAHIERSNNKVIVLSAKEIKKRICEDTAGLISG